jgi:ABC-2 type transport system ATP-binding protein
MSAKVLVRDLQKRYAGVDAVRGVSFAIEPGEIFGLLGPNGAGKTTTVECLIGLREADSGELEVCGLDARRHPQEVKQRIGVALQSTSLQDQITPREALKMFGAFYRQRTDPETLLKRFSLIEKADARFDTLSGGQRQRLALALAFVNQPELVMLDEPTTGLDPQSRRELHDDIVQMKHDGCTVLLTTHYLEEAERLCDRIAIINHGRIVATGTPRELMAQRRGAQSVRLVTARPLDLARLAKLPAVQDVAGKDNEVTFHTTAATDMLGALTPWLAAEKNDIVDLQVRAASLEDVFIELTRDPEKR